MLIEPMYVLAPKQTVEKFPYSIGDLRRDTPNTSFPRQPSDELLASYNVFPVVEQQPPSYDPATQNLNQVNPILTAGKWLQTWQVTDASSEEVAERTETKAAEVRQQRNAMLSGSDWTQLPDAPVDTPDWAAYRQDLRDLPEQPGFPWDVIWPDQP